MSNTLPANLREQKMTFRKGILCCPDCDTNIHRTYWIKWRDYRSMDKRKVITAYQRGFITIQECGQILGLEQVQLNRLIFDFVDDRNHVENTVQPINS